MSRTPGSRPPRRRKAGSPTHVVTVPLRGNQRDVMLIDQRLRLVGMLRNSTLQSLRTDELFASAEWRQAKDMPAGNKEQRRARAQQLKDLRYQAGLYRDGAVRVAHAHWKAGPYSDLLDSWTALAIGAEVWAAVEPWLFGQRGRPRFKRSDQRDVVWGNGIKCGIRIVEDCLVWQSDAIRRAPKGSKLARKRLQIPLDLSALSSARREDLQARQLLRVGIQRRQVRGKMRYVALLCVDGLPYRNQDYLDGLAESEGRSVGLDMGVSKLAVATREQAEIVPLCDPTVMEARKQAAALERRRRRAVARSRAAANPHAYDRQGRSRKGVRQPVKSRRGQARQAVLANTARVSAERRKQDRAHLAHVIRRLGDQLIIESADYRQWRRRQLRWAKTLGLTSPGLMHQALKWETQVTGAAFREIDPWQNASTQRCLCGARQKKTLNERTHQCASCGLVADRDLLPAYLACLLGETGLATLDDLLPVEAQTLGAPPDLTGSRSRAGSSGRSRATGESTTASSSDPRSIEADRSGDPARDVQAGSRAKDDSDPASRRHRLRAIRGSRLSGESSATRKANHNSALSEPEPRALASGRHRC